MAGPFCPIFGRSLFTAAAGFPKPGYPCPLQVLAQIKHFFHAQVLWLCCSHTCTRSRPDVYSVPCIGVLCVCLYKWPLFSCSVW